MKASDFLVGLITGAVVGGVVGLLAAPQSGEDLQSALRERANLVMEEGRRAAAERRAELEAQFAQSKQIPLNT
ncbi:MAG: YtxH-like protein [Chloroflexi bacterium ADurb.Bin325]|nr:MAG: YtxH-like protein [Chloroflexi bacterium ADurb.Bin325]